jgi:hypothetical protein
MLTMNMIDPLAAVKATALPSALGLAKAFKKVDALLIQAIHDETIKEPHPEDGFVWCRISYGDLSKHLACSAKTVRRAVARLEESGVLISMVSSVYNERLYDGTKSYRLAYAKIAKQVAD